MEIELTENQKNAIKAFTDAGHDEKKLINQFINIGILFTSSNIQLQKTILAMVEPK